MNDKDFFQTISKFSFSLLIIVTMSACGQARQQGSDHHRAQLVNLEEQQVPEEPQYLIGEAAPDFSLLDLQNNPVKLADLRGKIVVIHFATTWCPFCNAEAPYLEDIYQNYQDQGVEVLIVDVKEPRKLVQRKLQDRFNFTFPVLLDEDGEVAISYAPEGVLPELTRDEVVLASNLLIDRDGKIQFYTLLNSKYFDAKLIGLKARLNDIL